MFKNYQHLQMVPPYYTKMCINIFRNSCFLIKYYLFDNPNKKKQILLSPRKASFCRYRLQAEQLPQMLKNRGRAWTCHQLF